MFLQTYANMLMLDVNVYVVPTPCCDCSMLMLAEANHQVDE